MRCVTFKKMGCNKIYVLTRISSIFGYTQENNYKILSRWNKMPDLLRKMYPTMGIVMILLVATFIHGGSAQISNFSGKSFVPFMICFLYIKLPAALKLEFSPGSWAHASGYEGTHHFLAASYQTLAAHWKRSSSPPFGAFVESLKYVMCTKMLTALSEDKSTVFFSIW